MGKSSLAIIVFSLFVMGCASTPDYQTNRKICEDFEYYVAFEPGQSIQIDRVEEILYDCRYTGKVLNQDGDQVGKLSVTPFRLIGKDRLDTHDLFMQYERNKDDLVISQAKYKKIEKGVKYKNLIKSYPIKDNPKAQELVVLLQHETFQVFLSMRNKNKDSKLVSDFEKFVSKVEITKKD